MCLISLSLGLVRIHWIFREDELTLFQQIFIASFYGMQIIYHVNLRPLSRHLLTYFLRAVSFRIAFHHDDYIVMFLRP